jgi:prolyl oligopeptidase
MDSFKSLEDTESPTTRTYYKEHNQKVDTYLRSTVVEYFADILARQTESDSRGLPHYFGLYMFWLEQKDAWKSPKLMYSYKGGGPQVALEYGAEVSLDFWFPSPNGKYVVYGTSLDGNEQTTIRVRDIVNVCDLADCIPFAGFTDQGGVVWNGSSSFIYPRMNGFNKTGDPDKWLLGTKLYQHRIGDNPIDDTLVFGKNLPDTVMLTPTFAPDMNILLVTVCPDELTHDVYVVSLDTLESRLISAGAKGAFYVKIIGKRVLAHTNYSAPRYRVLSCALDELVDVDGWDEIIPESEAVLDDVLPFSSNQIVCLYSRDISSHISLFDIYGNQTGHVDIPSGSVVGSIASQPKIGRLSFSLSGFTTPPSIHTVSKATLVPESIWQRTALDGDEDISVTQYWATSKDGTRIPYFVVKQKSNSQPSPTICYGYGGFNISLRPSYLSFMRPWVLSGGIYVLMNLRGGGELGEEWHVGGSMRYKQNTFDDCIAIGQDLVAQNLCTPEQLGVMGGSNGGLTVAAVTVQAPELYRAGVSLVPLTDMLEFYKHQVAEFWVHEYGDPRIPEQLEWLRSWSPYHYPINADKVYPALYFETALQDARVHPMHALKMVARLHGEVRHWKGPLLLRTITDSGHQGSNKTKQELARQTAEYLAFFAKELGLKLEHTR